MRAGRHIAIIVLSVATLPTYAEEFHSRYWAQDTGSLEEDIEEPDELFDQETPPPEQSRRGHLQFTMVPFGFAVYPIPSYGAQIAYLWSEDWGVEYLYDFGNADIFERQVKTEKTALRAFYLLPYGLQASAGGGLRNVRSESLPSKDDGERSSVSLAIADFSLGKSWLTETFVVAIDFWGVAIPLRPLQIRGEDLREGEDRSAETKRFSNMQYNATYQVLRFRFGAEF